MRTSSDIPISVITGFLGSGKTTFLNWLLAQPMQEKIAVVVNEFGDIGLDHQLIATPVENIVLVEGGCLCCEVRGDLVQTLSDLMERRARGEFDAFDHIVIETTGLSNPIPIIQTILCDEDLAGRFALGRVITLIDGVHGSGQLDRHLEAVRQAAVADLLLISKSDLVADPQDLELLRSRLRHLNPGGRQVHSDHGHPTDLQPADILLRDDSHERRDFMKWIEQGERYAADGSLFRQPQLKSRTGDSAIETFSLRRPGEIAAANMTAWLNLLATMKGERLLRLKAILNVEGQPLAIHAAQTIVHEPVQLPSWPSDDRDSRFVVISHGPMKESFEASLRTLDLPIPIVRGTAPPIDPAAYQNFLRMAQAFSSRQTSA
jgi:G3E family GTPase